MTGIPNIAGLLATIGQALDVGVDTCLTLEDWVAKHGSRDQYEYTKGRRPAVQRGRDALRELQQYADQLRGRPLVIYADRDDDESEDRCRCQDPGARPPCGFCENSANQEEGGGPTALEVLADLRDRLVKATRTLEERAATQGVPGTVARLRAKATGVRLAESYVCDTIRTLPFGPHQPRRGDEVEAWVRAARDRHGPGSQVWAALDAMLDEYRERADRGIPLTAPAPMVPPPPLGGE